MTPPRVVTIDGAAGSGKSTLARALARRLGLPYVNTGLMYRGLAAAALRVAVGVDDEDGLVEVTRSLRFRLEGHDPVSLRVEGYPDEVLTSPEVERTVSAVSRHPGVRDLMRRVQRSLGLEGGAVMEGRDIGSVVFSDAPVKLYLVAEPTARAARRARERDAGQPDVAAGIRARDTADARTNPFEPPPGADVIDTGSLSIQDTLDEAIRVIRARAGWLLTVEER